jgi:hypothetical protein
MARTNCPESPAVIQSSRVYCSDDDQRPFIGFIRYSYRAGLRTYYGVCSASFLTSQQALQFIEKCHASRTVARYKPENPEESCLFARVRHIVFEAVS